MARKKSNFKKRIRRLPGLIKKKIWIKPHYRKGTNGKQEHVKGHYREVMVEMDGKMPATRKHEREAKMARRMAKHRMKQKKYELKARKYEARTKRYA